MAPAKGWHQIQSAKYAKEEGLLHVNAMTAMARGLLAMNKITELQVTKRGHVQEVTCPYNGSKVIPTVCSIAYCTTYTCCFYAGRYENVTDGVNIVLCGFDEGEFGKMMEERARLKKEVE